MIIDKPMQERLNRKLVEYTNNKTDFEYKKTSMSNKLGAEIKAAERKIKALAATITQKNVDLLIESGAFDDFEIEEITGQKQSLDF